MTRNSIDRWWSARTAYERAQNPEIKAFWLELMKHFSKDFN